MSHSQLPPVENGPKQEREEDADAAKELHKAPKETLERRNVRMSKKCGIEVHPLCQENLNI